MFNYIIHRHHYMVSVGGKKGRKFMLSHNSLTKYMYLYGNLYSMHFCLIILLGWGMKIGFCWDFNDMVEHFIQFFSFKCNWVVRCGSLKWKLGCLRWPEVLLCTFQPELRENLREKWSCNQYFSLKMRKNLTESNFS